MKILLIDIEVTPTLAWTYELRNANIGPDQIVQAPFILCFAAQWYGQDEIEFWDYRDTDGMLLRLWQLLDEADAVIYWYGDRFDLPHINREMWEHDFLPFSPVGRIDLWATAAKRFKFPSNSLAYVSQLAGTPKLKTGGTMALTLKCLEGDPDAWRRMQEYNMGDVKAMVPVYASFLPWITNHPSYGSLTGEDVCPACGSADLVKQGCRITRTGRYQRYTCRNCGHWSSATRREAHTEVVSIAA